MEVAGTIINSFDDPNNIDVENLLKMEKLISFNIDLWNKDLAVKFVVYCSRDSANFRFRTILTLGRSQQRMASHKGSWRISALSRL